MPPASENARAGLEIRPEPLDSPVAQQLIAELNAELSRAYAPEQRFHALAAEEVAEGAGAFVVAWLDGEPAGCGAVRLLPEADGGTEPQAATGTAPHPTAGPDAGPKPHPASDSGAGTEPEAATGTAPHPTTRPAAELKRMYVRPPHRRRGLARPILSTLEDRAAELCATRVVLETGVHQDAAIALYESAGYVRIPPFGPYAASPTSVCYEKRLGV